MAVVRYTNLDAGRRMKTGNQGRWDTDYAPEERPERWPWLRNAFFDAELYNHG
jgi:hypothetical protein